MNAPEKYSSDYKWSLDPKNHITRTFEETPGEKGRYVKQVRGVPKLFAGVFFGPRACFLSRTFEGKLHILRKFARVNLIAQMRERLQRKLKKMCAYGALPKKAKNRQYFKISTSFVLPFCSDNVIYHIH